MANPRLSVVFDLDGTLIHSNPEIAAAVNKVMAIKGLEPFGEPQIQSFVGNGLTHLVGLVCGARGLPDSQIAPMAELVLAEYMASAGAYSLLFPNVLAALETLREGGHRLGVCTNKPFEAARENLAHFGLDGFFEVLIGGDSLPERKPHPRPLIKASEALGGACVFVGDSEVDEETARRAKMPFLFFTGGYCKRPESELSFAAKFDDFADLPALVSQVQGKPRVG